MANTVRLGYLRVSTAAQDLQLQHDALDGAKVLKRDRYEDKGVSGTRTKRPGLDNLLADARSLRADGHEVVIVVYALDRLGRSAAHILTLMQELDDEGIAIVSIRDGIDSTTTQGKIMMKLLSVVADIERSILVERTTAGLASARSQGRTGGRPRATDTKQQRQAQALRDAGERPEDIAKALGISTSTAYRITKAPAAKK